jgi:FKBP-type peptidyl-prolyl cis-trans isomerase FkpA
VISLILYSGYCSIFVHIQRLQELIQSTLSDGNYRLNTSLKTHMKYLLLFVSAALLVSACGKKSDNCTAVPGTTVAPDAEKTRVTNYLATNPDAGAVQLESSGLYYSVSVAGSAKKPTVCNRVEVKYVGKREDGGIFDQTPGTGSTTFPLGNLIEGWKRALPLIGEGGKMRIYIPPSLGYGPAGLINNQTGTVIIPANQIIIFDVELVSVR